MGHRVLGAVSARCHLAKVEARARELIREAERPRSGEICKHCLIPAQHVDGASLFALADARPVR